MNDLLNYLLTNYKKNNETSAEEEEVFNKFITYSRSLLKEIPIISVDYSRGPITLVLNDYTRVPIAPDTPFNENMYEPGISITNKNKDTNNVDSYYIPV